LRHFRLPLCAKKLRVKQAAGLVRQPRPAHQRNEV
jgi:hypothetical protein